MSLDRNDMHRFGHNVKCAKCVTYIKGGDGICVTKHMLSSTKIMQKEISEHSYLFLINIHKEQKQKLNP